ncbi:MAG: cytochrome C [Acidobacteriota bacterium]|nr:cytochrome C [Acidobacteriota bacterium]
MNTKKLLLFVFVSVLAVAQQSAVVRPAWAFPTADKEQPPAAESSEPVHLPGSTKTYTPAQIDDLINPPDWYPEDHGPLPPVIGRGTAPNAPACGSCHLQSGQGHPESADLAGLPAEYLARQMLYFKSGTRKDPARMTAIGKAVSDADARQAAEWFAALKPGAWIKVVEADTLPRSYVRAAGRIRLPHPAGGTEPLGNRIVELPINPDTVTARDPHTGFTAYVPKGSIAKGAALASSGIGKTVTCAICHGEGLKGLGDVPRLAGLHPIYIVRQLYNFQSGASAGSQAALMKRVVANLTEDDMIALAAYAASLNP